jgi:hypothetical protein
MEMKQRFLASAVLVAATSFSALAQAPAVPPLKSEKPSGPVPGTLLVDDYVKNVAALAYVWGWPMVNIRNRHLVFSKGMAWVTEFCPSRRSTA